MTEALKKRISSSEEMKRLSSNIFSLGILQVANYVLPLLTFPYLVRVLGPDNFGLLAFASATSMYFLLITDYGFNLSATQMISVNRDNQYRVNEIFSSVMTIKSGLLVISLALMALLVFSFERFNQQWEIHFLTFGIVVGQTLFPVWLFQGLERMKYITYINISAKVFFTVCIFIFVHDREDCWIVPTLNSLGFIIAGICSLYIANKQIGVKFSWPTVTVIKEQLFDGYHVFVSSISISLYTISTTFILGLFAGNLIVGYYAIAEKLIQAVNGLYVPISQSIYPLVSQKLHKDIQVGLVFIRKVILIVGAAMLIISTLLFLFSAPIVHLLFGETSQESILLLRIMAMLPFFIALSNILGIQIMLNLGLQRTVSQILFAAAVLGIGLNLALVPIYEAVGSAVSLVVVEIFVTITMVVYLKIKSPVFDKSL